MSMTSRLSCLAAALLWLPAALAQLNPPLTGAGAASPAPVAAPAPSPAAAVSPAPALPGARPLVRQVPATPPTGVTQAVPVPVPNAASAPATPSAAAPVVAAPPAPSPSAAAARPGSASMRAGSGDTVRGLMALQASGRAAGPARPVLGPTATAAWDRYVESFTQPIPEWFERRVDDVQ